jgi:hypothetical protein
MDLLKTLKLRKHHPYSPPAKTKTIWRKRCSKCKYITRKDWPKVMTFPWRKPKYYEGGDDK